MDFGTAIRSCFNKYVTFSGRAARSEMWFFILFGWLGQIILTIVDTIILGAGVLGGLFGLAILLPTISVVVRRLHDTDRSGWWYWIALVPIVGFILLIVWCATKGTTGSNQYGADPLSSDGWEDPGDPADYSSSSIPRVDRD